MAKNSPPPRCVWPGCGRVADGARNLCGRDSLRAQDVSKIEDVPLDRDAAVIAIVAIHARWEKKRAARVQPDRSLGITEPPRSSAPLPEAVPIKFEVTLREDAPAKTPGRIPHTYRDADRGVPDECVCGAARADHVGEPAKEPAPAPARTVPVVDREVVSIDADLAPAEDPCRLGGDHGGRLVWHAPGAVGSIDDVRGCVRCTRCGIRFDPLPRDDERPPAVVPRDDADSLRIYLDSVGRADVGAAATEQRAYTAMSERDRALVDRLRGALVARATTEWDRANGAESDIAEAAAALIAWPGKGNPAPIDGTAAEIVRHLIDEVEAARTIALQARQAEAESDRAVTELRTIRDGLTSALDAATFRAERAEVEVRGLRADLANLVDGAAGIEARCADLVTERDAIRERVRLLEEHNGTRKREAWEALGEPASATTWPLLLDEMRRLRGDLTDAEARHMRLVEGAVRHTLAPPAGLSARDRAIAAVMLDGLEADAQGTDGVYPLCRAALTTLRLLLGITDVS